MLKCENALYKMAKIPIFVLYKMQNHNRKNVECDFLHAEPSTFLSFWSIDSFLKYQNYNISFQYFYKS